MRIPHLYAWPRARHVFLVLASAAVLLATTGAACSPGHHPAPLYSLPPVSVTAPQHGGADSAHKLLRDQLDLDYEDPAEERHQHPLH